MNTKCRHQPRKTPFLGENPKNFFSSLGSNQMRQPRHRLLPSIKSASQLINSNFSSFLHKSTHVCSLKSFCLAISKLCLHLRPYYFSSISFAHVIESRLPKISSYFAMTISSLRWERLLFWYPHTYFFT